MAIDDIEGVLLYGPPGVGKTYLVASIAKVCGAEMVSGSSIIMWITHNV
jgi:transitional endoplasmic reticulum ATPase